VKPTEEPGDRASFGAGNVNGSNCTDLRDLVWAKVKAID
jgi:hypothetical protein